MLMMKQFSRNVLFLYFERKRLSRHRIYVIAKIIDRLIEKCS